MPVAHRNTARENLQLANRTRQVRARQRRALRGAPPRTLLPVVIDPPKELASYQLRELFGTYCRGLIPMLASSKLDRVLASLNRRCVGRNWHRDMRLRSLSKREREMLCEELMRKGPRAWRNS